MEDANIVKVGVDLASVCMKLTKYDIYVASILDLRYLAVKCNFQIGPLAALSATHLGVQLSENRRLEQRHWCKQGTSELDENDKNYASICVRAAIELFKVFKKSLTNSNSIDDVHQFIDTHCTVHLNKFYKTRKATETEVVSKVQNGIRLPKPKIEVVRGLESFKFVLRMLREYV